MLWSSPPRHPMVVRVREVVVERHGDLKLVVGGKHGYVRVRGGQGSTKNMYQGYTKSKKHFTAGYPTPQEAAIALAELERDLAAGLDEATRKRLKSASGKRPGACPNPSPTFSHTQTIISSPHIPSCAAACHRSRGCDAKFFADTTLDNGFGAFRATPDHTAAQPSPSSSAASQHRLQHQYPQHASSASMSALQPDSMPATVAHASAGSACVRARHDPGTCAYDAVAAVRA